MDELLAAAGVVTVVLGGAGVGVRAGTGHDAAPALVTGAGVGRIGSTAVLPGEVRSGGRVAEGVGATAGVGAGAGLLTTGAGLSPGEAGACAGRRAGDAAATGTTATGCGGGA